MNYKFIFRQSAASISGFAKIGLKTINNYSFVISSDVSPLKIDGEFIFTVFASPCLLFHLINYFRRVKQNNNGGKRVF